MTAPRSMPCELLLLPGLDGTGRLFEWFEVAMGADIPSRRISYPADATLGYDELLAHVVSELGMRRAIVLGESFSGPLAIELAARFPERVAGLILVSTFLRSPWPPAVLRLSSVIDPRRVPRTLRRLAMLGVAGDDSLRRMFDDIVDGLAPDLIAARLLQISRVDASATLTRVRAPILALHGRHDRLVSPREMKSALAERLDAEFVSIDGPHMLLQANPTEAARHVRAFYARCVAEQRPPRALPRQSPRAPWAGCRR